MILRNFIRVTHVIPHYYIIIQLLRASRKDNRGAYDFGDDNAIRQVNEIFQRRDSARVFIFCKSSINIPRRNRHICKIPYR